MLRREVSAGRRAAKHRRLVAAATTDTGRLWRACNWLAAEGKAHGQLTIVLAIILDLIKRLRAGETLTVPDGTAPPAAAPQNASTLPPWYVRTRETAGGNRRDVA